VATTRREPSITHLRSCDSSPVLVGSGKNFDAVLDRMLDDLTSMLRLELGSDLGRVTTDQLERKPDLANEPKCRQLLIGMIVRPGDLEPVEG